MLCQSCQWCDGNTPVRRTFTANNIHTCRWVSIDSPIITEDFNCLFKWPRSAQHRCRWCRLSPLCRWAPRLAVCSQVPGRFIHVRLVPFHTSLFQVLLPAVLLWCNLMRWFQISYDKEHLQGNLRYRPRGTKISPKARAEPRAVPHIKMTRFKVCLQCARLHANIPHLKVMHFFPYIEF